MLLSKGFEVEMFTGTPGGQAVGFSDQIAATLPGFVREPDNRNVEYTTPPIQRYEHLLCPLVEPRIQLRHYLKTLGDYTLLPGSTLAMGGSEQFHRSDPGNPYHTYIEQTYGTTVVTASIHINIGLDTPDLIFRACRLLRLEAPLYLALTASSPFLDGQVSGFHSTRWHLFPATPSFVPLFEDHAHYIHWTQEQLALGTMQNVRHLWASVRPNGPSRPYDLNRVELRICDLVADPLVLLAVTALIEARLYQLLRDPERLDPLRGSLTPQELLDSCYQNEQAAAQHSLEAQLISWQTGNTLSASEWIDALLAEAWMEAYPYGFSCFLAPLQRILRDGNEAQQWLKQVAQRSLADVYQTAIEDLHQQDCRLRELICQQSYSTMASSTLSL